MQSANILLALGGDSGNQVPKFQVTAAEIAVLQAIHGDDSVSEIQPVKGDLVDPNITKRTNRAELARLKAVYGNARNDAGDLVVDTLFPGVAARVFENIDELDLDDTLFAAEKRANAADFEDDVDGDGTDAFEGMKVADLRKLANARKVDLDGVSKKEDIINKLMAAGVKLDDGAPKQDAGAGDIDEDGVGDLPDGDNGVLG